MAAVWLSATAGCTSVRKTHRRPRCFPLRSADDVVASLGRATVTVATSDPGSSWRDEILRERREAHSDEARG
jgi:hypothetical protein